MSETRELEALVDDLRIALGEAVTDNYRMHLLYEIEPPQKNAVGLMYRYREALTWLVDSRPYPSAECWANATAALEVDPPNE